MQLRQSDVRSWIPFTLALALACSAKANGGMVTVTQTDDQKEVSVAAGKEFVVRLPSSLGTGYSWDVDTFDAAKVEKLGQTEEPAKDAKPGVTGETVFRFRALAAGTSAVSFKYLRPWEKTAPPAKTFSVNVVVK